MITRRAVGGQTYDLRIAGTGVMLRPTAEGAALVSRRMVELEEPAGMDNAGTRGLVMEYRCTVIAAERVPRRDGRRDALSDGASILRTVQRAAADAGPDPTEFRFADDAEAFTGNIYEFAPSLIRSWPLPAYDISITIRAPAPVP